MYPYQLGLVVLGVHSVTWATLDEHFQKNPVMRNTRVFSMLNLGGLFLTGVVLEGHENCYKVGHPRHKCLFIDLNGHVGGKPGF